MRIDTPAVATHLLTDPEKYFTPIGVFLRKLSLDEFPQLFSVLKGDMSFVGPRPALFNQDDLIELRIKKGIHNITPGLTGWAQINGRDELPIPVKVDLDYYYLNNRSFIFDMKILFMTFSMSLAAKALSIDVFVSSGMRDVHWFIGLFFKLPEARQLTSILCFLFSAFYFYLSSS